MDVISPCDQASLGRIAAAVGRSCLMLSLAVVLAACSHAKAQDDKVKVTFVVSVPDKTDPKDIIYVSGNQPELGNFDGKGLALDLQDGGEYSASVRFAKGTKLEFKVTRGSWDTVEKGENGAEIPNRTAELTGDRTEKIKVITWRDKTPQPSKYSTLTGDIRVHADFRSQALANRRNVQVWLPPGYDSDPGRHYPVLYMHDGQNVFDEATSFSGEWHADETATRLIAEHRIEPIIIVSLDNAGPGRVEEYTPTPGEDRINGTTKITGGKGELYSRFLIDELKPFIDTTYRTLPDREHTAVCGSSLGGLISLHLAWKHGDVFGKAAMMSPSVWWNKSAALVQLQTDNKWMKREKLWLDMGTEEGNSPGSSAANVREARALLGIMQRAGLKKGTDYMYEEDEGAAHNEGAWSERFERVLVFFFGN